MELMDVFGDVFEDEPEDSFPTLVKPTVKRDGNFAVDLKEDLLDWLVTGKVDPPRKPGLHCSSLWRTCPRVPLLEKKYAEYVKVEQLTAGQQLTYGVGHAVHDLMQNVFLGDFGRLWGNWVCLSCSPNKEGDPAIVHQGTLPRKCPDCKTPWQYGDGTKNIVYAEMFVEDEILKYCGHCDGIMLSRQGNKFVFEFKTISKSQYKGLKNPKHEHIVQVHAYMNALGMDQAVVLYLDKGSQADWKKLRDGTWISPNPHIKSFLVKFDPVLWEDIKVRIADYHKADNLAKTLPVIEIDQINEFPRICTHKGCDMAGDCGIKEMCFAI